MNASELMTRNVKSCRADDNLQRAAEIMWEVNCGAVPVVDPDRRVIGVITDRDVCMAAYTQGRHLAHIPVSSAMAKQVYCVRESDDLEAAEALMARVRVRRLPVLNADGRLAGILSMNDLARHAHAPASRRGDGLRSDHIIRTLAAICEPSVAAGSKEPPVEAGPAQLTA
jgi:CBS domain-containing protein